MNTNLKIFVTIFCYISGVAGLVTVFTAMNAKPADSSTAVIGGVLGVCFLIAGVALTRKPRY